MLATVLSSACLGIEAYLVQVEVDLSNGLPAFNIVGLPDTACRESADRVRAAIKNSGVVFPSKKITVNLAPADLKKEGSAFDLAIAVGILAANEMIPMDAIADKIFCGELSLDGSLRAVSGILPRAAFILDHHHEKSFVIGEANAKEALCLEGLNLYAAKNLTQVLRFLNGEESICRQKGAEAPAVKKARGSFALDFSDIKGQKHAKRALEIAAAGRHNALLIGPPGSGKTMLAKRMPTILSSITFKEAVETTKIHSVAGLTGKNKSLVEQRPFRDPHHTISDIAMIGGGTTPKPGEVSLAHNGVLFLDEIAEFKKNVLEVLRQPLEEGSVAISRASMTLRFPARFMMVAATNPCPCGHFGDPKHECHCNAPQIKKYLSKISGPLLDRIDIQLEVPCLSADEIVSEAGGDSSDTIRRRVEQAQDRQRHRYQDEEFAANAQLEARQVEKYCAPTAAARKLLKMAVENLGFSARAYHKVLKVARTIADLEGLDSIEDRHISEAVHYRSLDRYTL